MLWARNWDKAGPAGEPGGWEGAIVIKQPAPRAEGDLAQAGDVVTVDPDDLEGPGLLTQKVERVGSDGTIRLPYVGKLRASGLTRAEIQADAKSIYRRAIFIDYEWVRVSVATGDRRIPYRLIVGASALVPLAWLVVGLPPTLRRWRGRRRLLANLCPSCGYDLRAAPGRCPECGAPVKERVPECGGRKFVTGAPEGDGASNGSAS